MLSPMCLNQDGWMFFRERGKGFNERYDQWFRAISHRLFLANGGHRSLLENSNISWIKNFSLAHILTQTNSPR